MLVVFSLHNLKPLTHAHLNHLHLLWVHLFPEILQQIISILQGFLALAFRVVAVRITSDHKKLNCSSSPFNIVSSKTIRTNDILSALSNMNFSKGSSLNDNVWL
jgi:hypothetical protein